MNAFHQEAVRVKQITLHKPKEHDLNTQYYLPLTSLMFQRHSEVISSFQKVRQRVSP